MLLFQRKKITLYVKDEASAIWASYRQFAPVSKEACGVLIGSYDIEDNCHIIESVTVPLLDDLRSRSSFTLKDKGHQAVVDRAYKASGGKQGYLGTWHTHPEPNPTPSRVDTRDWEACIKRNEDRQLFFVIVGTEKVKVFVKSKHGFDQLTNLRGI